MKKSGTWMMAFVLLLMTTGTQAESDNIGMAVWANEAIVRTYTFNYQNYLAQQKEIARYFTADAWKAYSQALIASKLPETVQKNKYNVSAVATWPPELKKIDAENWQAQMPVLVVYENPQYKQKQTLEITITFKSAPAGAGVRGLAITSLQSKTIEESCVCPSSENQNRT